ncbi:MAG: hypothetical protein JOZ82_09005, partial [Marmoricola sp.]|nr:hypothetical protein [Marmoricola sp.]
MRVLLATRNDAKLEELRRMVAARGVEVVGLADVPAFPEAPEVGATFEENALAKARDAATATGLVAVADDASEKDVEVAATVQGKSAKVVIEVVSPEKLAALLATGQKAENDDAAVAVVTTTSLGAREATATDSSKKRKAIFLGVV